MYAITPTFVNVVTSKRGNKNISKIHSPRIDVGKLVQYCVSYSASSSKRFHLYLLRKMPYRTKGQISEFHHKDSLLRKPKCKCTGIYFYICFIDCFQAITFQGISLPAKLRDIFNAMLV